MNEDSIINVYAFLLGPPQFRYLLTLFTVLAAIRLAHHLPSDADALCLNPLLTNLTQVSELSNLLRYQLVLHLAISSIGDEIDLCHEPSRADDNSRKITSASIQCRFGRSSVSSPQPIGKLLGSNNVLLEYIYTAYSRLVSMAGLWHELK